MLLIQKVNYRTNHLRMAIYIMNVFRRDKLVIFIWKTGTALLTMSGSPNVRGLTIDTASDTQPIIDEWGTNDVSIDPITFLFKSIRIIMKKNVNRRW